MSFQKTKENFICQHCGHKIKGSGYTNHCPRCLWSKHVDISPGDRAEKCGGMMVPVRVEQKDDIYYIVHLCEQCGMEKRNKASQKDDFDILVNIVEKSTHSVAYDAKI